MTGIGIRSYIAYWLNLAILQGYCHVTCLQSVGIITTFLKSLTPVCLFIYFRTCMALRLGFPTRVLRNPKTRVLAACKPGFSGLNFDLHCVIKCPY